MTKSKVLHLLAITTVLVVISVIGSGVLAISGALGEEPAASMAQWLQLAQAQPRPNQRPAPPPARGGETAQQTPAAPPPTTPPAAAAAPAPPVRTETIVYDNWTVTCRDTVTGNVKKTCSATFQMTNQERNQVIFTWLLGRNAEGALVSVMQVPTGILIQRGVEFKIGNGAMKKLNFVMCDSQRCEASIQMDDALTKEMAAAQTAVATIFTPDGKGINFNMNPKGIDKAIGSIPR